MVLVAACAAALVVALPQSLTPSSAVNRERVALHVDRVVPVVEPRPAGVVPDELAAEAARASRSAVRAALPPAYVVPVVGPVTSPFGRRWGRLHAGLDFGVPIGTPVLAVTDGVAQGEQWDPRGYGHYVTVLHADGTVSVYGHLSQVLLPTGPVRAGQVLGLSGDSGHSTGPHLHFELRSAAGPFDPRPWLLAHGLTV